MAKQFFRQLDNFTLERYTKKSVPRRRKLSVAKKRYLINLRRAFQSLPPRELQMLYVVKVNGVEQEEARKMYSVRQSNVSYRLERSKKRIKLFNEIVCKISETQIRRTLISMGFPENTIQAVCGVIRTTSQTATAAALKVSQGSVRHMYSQVMNEFAEKIPESEEMKLLKLVEASYNNLRAISAQKRFIWKKKVGGSDTPTNDPLATCK